MLGYQLQQALPPQKTAQICAKYNVMCVLFFDKLRS